MYYTTGHSIVVADILKDLVNLESDVTGIQSPNLGHHATYSLKRKKNYIPLIGWDFATTISFLFRSGILVIFSKY